MGFGFRMGLGCRAWGLGHVEGQGSFIAQQFRVQGLRVSGLGLNPKP